MDVDRAQIATLVEEIVRKVTNQMGDNKPVAAPAAPAIRTSGSRPADPDGGTFATQDDAIAAAHESQREWMGMNLEQRGACVSKMREVALQHAQELAEMAVRETRMGRVEDKYKKLLVCINKTPGLEDLEPTVYTGDHGLTLMELAPFGVIGSITPTTNPVATIINNSISMICAGNGVVYNPHPRAMNCSMRTLALMNGAIAQAGGPRHLLTTVAEPTQATSASLMTHKDIDCLVVTGGPGVVRAAMKSGKKCIAAGPGNPPCIVDETADLVQAARDMVFGASFDCNIMCTCEKETIVVDHVYREFIQRVLENNCVMLTPLQFEDLNKVLFKAPAVGKTETGINKELVGLKPCDIARYINLEVPESTRLLVAETPADHPLVFAEQLMPVMPIVRVRNVDEAIDLAIKAEGKCYHTATMHSHNIVALSKMSRLCNCNIFVKNGPNLSGLGFNGEGHTTLTIAGTTGDGLTSARTFTRQRRCVLVDKFRII